MRRNIILTLIMLALSAAYGYGGTVSDVHIRQAF